MMKVNPEHAEVLFLKKNVNNYDNFEMKNNNFKTAKIKYRK